MTPNLQERVNAALSTVRNNRLGINVLEAEMVRDVATTMDGKVRFTILLAPSDDAAIVRDARQVVQQVEGVSEVRVDVKDVSQAGVVQEPTPEPGPKPKSRSLPVMGHNRHPRRPPCPRRRR